MQAWPMRRLIIPGTFYAVLLAVVVLYATDPVTAKRVLQLWIEHPYRYPFLDWEWMSRSVECWRQGVNVYVENPCPEPVQTVLFTQSPLWLRTPLPIGDQWVRPVGLALAVLFGLAIASLPPVRRWYECLIMTLVAVSSVAVFALERANVDVILFLMLMAGARLWRGRLPLRLLAYAVIFVAGLLKYFPMAALILCLRERMRVLLLVGGTAAAVLLALVFGYRDELRAALHNVPTVWYFGDGFGAIDLPFGLAAIAPRVAERAGLTDPALLRLVILFLKNAAVPCLLVAMFAYALWLSDKAGVRRELAGLEPKYVGPLVAGAAVIVGCFVTGRSIGYRGIFLIPSVPGLLTLARTLPSAAARRCVLGTCLAIVFVMWALTLQGVMYSMGLIWGHTLDNGAAGIVLFVFKEMAWWWIVATLMTVLIGFTLNSEFCAGLNRLLSPSAGRVRASVRRN